jgi:hypothetical protein
MDIAQIAINLIATRVFATSMMTLIHGAHEVANTDLIDLDLVANIYKKFDAERSWNSWRNLEYFR